MVEDETIEEVEEEAEEEESSETKTLKQGKGDIRPNFNFLLKKKDIRILILGADGSGKTVLGHNLLEQFHNAGVPCSFWAPVTISKHPEKYFKGDMKWLNIQNWKWPKLERNTMHLIDDTQLQAHAREHWKKRNINYAKIMTVARHKHAGVIITTQQGADIDKKLLAKAHVILFKKPTFLGAETERPFLKEISKDVRLLYKRDIESKGLNPQEYTYVISDLYMGWVGPNGFSSYWTTELGDW